MGVSTSSFVFEMPLMPSLLLSLDILSIHESGVLGDWGDLISVSFDGGVSEHSAPFPSISVSPSSESWLAGGGEGGVLGSWVSGVVLLNLRA